MSALQARGPGLHRAVFSYLYFCALGLSSVMGKVHQRKPMEEREAAIFRSMKKVGRLRVTTISRIVEWNKTTVYTVLSGKAAFAKRGRKKVMKQKDVNQVVKTLQAIIWKTHARWEVTLAMSKKSAKGNLDDKVVRKALLEKKIKFPICIRLLVDKNLLQQRACLFRSAHATSETILGSLPSVPRAIEDVLPTQPGHVFQVTPLQAIGKHPWQTSTNRLDSLE